MIIEPSMLSSEALDSLVQEYCLRDWGLNETESPLESRKAQVLQALKQGKLLIQFSEEEQSAHITSSETMGLG